MFLSLSGIVLLFLSIVQTSLTCGTNEVEIKSVTDCENVCERNSADGFEKYCPQIRKTHVVPGGCVCRPGYYRIPSYHGHLGPCVYEFVCVHLPEVHWKDFKSTKMAIVRTTARPAKRQKSPTKDADKILVEVAKIESHARRIIADCRVAGMSKELKMAEKTMEDLMSTLAGILGGDKKELSIVVNRLSQSRPEYSRHLVHSILEGGEISPKKGNEIINEIVKDQFHLAVFLHNHPIYLLQKACKGPQCPFLPAQNTAVIRKVPFKYY